MSGLDSAPREARGGSRFATEGGRVEGRYKAPAQHEKIDEQDETADQVVSLEPARNSPW